MRATHNIPAPRSLAEFCPSARAKMAGLEEFLAGLEERAAAIRRRIAEVDGAPLLTGA